jgi:hypothetical protein
MILMELVFSQQIFKNYSNIKLHKNCPVEAELFHTYRRNKANSRSASQEIPDVSHKSMNNIRLKTLIDRTFFSEFMTPSTANL